MLHTSACNTFAKRLRNIFWKKLKTIEQALRRSSTTGTSGLSINPWKLQFSYWELHENYCGVILFKSKILNSEKFDTIFLVHFSDQTPKRVTIGSLALS